jgi:two-component system cell cycle response regulator
MLALIIDSSRSYRKLLSSVLANNGFLPVETDSFESGLRACQESSYGLICMSVVLPDGDSHELMSRIRVTQFNSNTPILILTASYSREILESFYALGVTEVFRKEDFINFEYFLLQFSRQINKKVQQGGRILYVEDHRSVAMATREILQNDGYTVVHVTSGEEALKLFSEEDFDLVLTDLLLEGELCGTALVRAIRNFADTGKQQIPVVAISAYGDHARRLELFRCGVNDYVQKPVLDEELLARVNNLVRTEKLLVQLNQQQQKLQEIALKDYLTNLYNRHFLMEIAPKRIAQAMRQSVQLSMLVADIDHFKRINDNYGHDMGDKILSAVANVLQMQARTEDVVSRYGGEEFVILLDHCNKQQASAKAEGIRQQIEGLCPEGINTTMSFGVAALNSNDDFDTLFKRADNALYQAKKGGRNRIEVG